MFCTQRKAIEKLSTFRVHIILYSTISFETNKQQKRQLWCFSQILLLKADQRCAICYSKVVANRLRNWGWGGGGGGGGGGLHVEE